MTTAIVKSSAGGGGADITQLLDGLKRLRRGGRAGTKDASVVIIRAWLQEVSAISPRDTRRYVRGWLLAGRDIGITDLAVPSLQATKYAEFYEKILYGQVEKLVREYTFIRSRMKLWFEDRGRPPTRWYNNAARQVAQIEKRLQTMLLQVARWESTTVAQTGIVFDARVNIAGWLKDGKNVQRLKGRKFASVREKVYGGEGGFITASNGITFGQVRNLEPHVKLIESRYGIVRKATAAVRRGARGVMVDTRTAFVGRLQLEAPNLFNRGKG